MLAFVLDHEAGIRLVAFGAIFALMAGWEWRRPLRAQRYGRWLRWPGNLAIAGLGTLLVRGVFPFAAVGVATLADAHDWGVFNAVATPLWLSVTASLIALDLAIYLQHVLVHAVPTLWRLHRMHHADLEFDVTTGSRFHPLEIALSMVIKMVVVASLGAPAFAVLLFEILLNATSMFNHGNVTLAPRFDRALRWLLVTPDMHRVHHSVVPRETNSNFGFNLSCWDRLFGTYRRAPAAGQLGMTIGIDQFREPCELRLARLLQQPFRGVDCRLPPC